MQQTYKHLLAKVLLSRSKAMAVSEERLEDDKYDTFQRKQHTVLANSSNQIPNTGSAI